MTDPEHAPGPLTMENVKRLEREQEAAASEALDANVNANANANVSSVTMDTADMPVSYTHLTLPTIYSV